MGPTEVTVTNLQAPQAERLKRLLGYLDRDSTNLALLEDAASAAFDVREFELASDLLGRRLSLAAPTPQLINLRALLGLAQERYEEAAHDLQHLRSESGDAPGIRFNLAWALAMQDQFAEASALLDEAAIAASPRGPSLKIQALHHLELYNEGLEYGAQLAAAYPDNAALMGALATLAMDAEQPELARSYAARGGGNAEALAALGMFALESQDREEASRLFDSALEQAPKNPRAWVGKGLSLLGSHDASQAASLIDKGADLFGDHLGSWVAAGWAYFLAGDHEAARDRFERVVALDGTFAEGHGGIAVIDVLSGDLAAAQRNCELALRLDPASMSGALAKSLLLEAGGDGTAAQRIRARALEMPVGPGGETLAQVLAASGSGFLRR